MDNYITYKESKLFSYKEEIARLDNKAGSNYIVSIRKWI